MMAALLVVGALFFFYALMRTESPEQQERWSAERAIKLCWEDQARKSLPPAQARFIAGACERMEADFRTKYRRNP